MAIPPSFNLPGVPISPMVDTENGEITPDWREYLAQITRLLATACFMANVTYAKANAPSLPTAANDAAAAAAGVLLWQFYWNGTSVVQRRV